MPNSISVQIDVTLIDKARLFQGKTNDKGHTPKYLNLILIPRKETGKFGDTHLVKQSLTKEEREAKVELPIIGNGKEFLPRPPVTAQTTTPPQQSAAAPDTSNIDEDVPF